MKAVLQLELFGDNASSSIRAMESIYRSMPGGKELWGPSERFPRPWVAQITGKDLKYKLKRNFLNPKKDYTHSNSKGSRGIFLVYILESGCIYEVNSQISWKNWERYFCTVDEQGDIIRLEESDLDDAMLIEDPDWD